MENDDLLPNDGRFFGVPLEPIEQSNARKREQAATLEAKTVLQEIIEQFEDDIEFYGSVDAIPPEVKAKPQQFLIVHNANELVRDALRAKKEYIESLLDAYVKK